MSLVEVNISHVENTTKPKKWIGVRHYQFVMMFMTLFISFGIRTSLSVAIISMTEKTSANSSTPTYPEWDNTDTILSSFVWGYVVPQILAGQLSEYFGAKWFLFTTMILSGIFHIVIPPMAEALGSTGVIICRIIQGLNQAFLFPCISYLMSNWSPLFERARVSNFVYGGATLGAAVSMPVTGAIAGSDLGWPVAFYIYGAVGIGWAIVFGVFAENSPSTHKRISEDERVYIESNNFVTQSDKKISTPWFSILKSLPLWAIVVAGIGDSWGGFTLLTEIPGYMNGIMNFDIDSNSRLSAVPYFVQFFLGLVTSPLTDKLVEKKFTSITTSRKIFNSLSSFIPAAALIFLAFLEDFKVNLVMALLIITVATTAFFQSGYLVNIIDLAPNHSGTLFGVVNIINNGFSLLAPLTVGLLGVDKTDPMLWRKVFLLAAAVYIVCGAFYLLGASAEVQPWNNIEEDEYQEKNKTKHFRT